eukprot:scaffold1452_cov64-Phaeocystis_antarctica.AAC.1
MPKTVTATSTVPDVIAMSGVVVICRLTCSPRTGGSGESDRSERCAWSGLTQVLKGVLASTRRDASILVPNDARDSSRRAAARGGGWFCLGRVASVAPAHKYVGL